MWDSLITRNGGEDLPMATEYDFPDLNEYKIAERLYRHQSVILRWYPYLKLPTWGK